MSDLYSRKNSITSLATTGSMVSRSPQARDLSTDNLMSLEEKFIKRSMKRPGGGHGTAVPPSAISGIPSGPTTSNSMHSNNALSEPSPVLNASNGEAFHKTNTGTYLFPNGEVFRPRTTPSKRNRPNKLHHHPEMNNTATESHTIAPPIDSTYLRAPFTSSQDSFHRNPSINSLHSLNNNSTSTLATNLSATPSIPRSNSYNNMKMLHKQNLVKDIRANKMDTPTNLHINPVSESTRESSLTSSTQIPRSNSFTTTPHVPHVVPFTSQLRTNSLTKSAHSPTIQPLNQLPTVIPASFVQSHNNGSSTSLRNTIYTSQPFNPYNPMHSHPKLQPTNIVKASSSENNSSLSSLPETTISPSTSLTNTSNESRSEILKLNVPTLTLKSDETRFSATSSNKSSAYSSSPSSEDPPIIDSSTYLSQTISNTPLTSININEKERFSNVATSTLPTNQTIEEHPAEVPAKDNQGVKEVSEVLDEEENVEEAFEVVHEEEAREIDTYSSGKTETSPRSTTVNADDTILSTLNEVSEENLTVKPTSITTDAVSPNTISYSLPVIGQANESEESLVYATPRHSPSEEQNRLLSQDSSIVPSLQPPSIIIPNQEVLPLSTLSHQRNGSILPEPTIDLSYEPGKGTPSSKTNNAESHDMSDYTLLYQSSPLNSGCSTPRNSKFFDFNSDRDAFNKFLNDTQEEVPPRGDLVIKKNHKIRKHERSVSSISSFNSIINGTEGELPRTPKRSQSPEGEVFSKALPPLKLKDSCMKSLPPSPKDPISIQSPTGEDFRSPVPLKESVPSSSDSSLNLYSINEASKTSLPSNTQMAHNTQLSNSQPVSKTQRTTDAKSTSNMARIGAENTPKQTMSMLDVLGDDPPTPISKNSPQKPVATTRPKPNTTSVPSESKKFGPTPKIPSPSPRTLKSHDFSRSMTSLGSIPNRTIPKRSTSVNNFRSFFRKVFNKSSTSINSTSMAESDIERKQSFNTSNILDSKSINSASYHSVNTSSASSRAESRSITPNVPAPTKNIKKSFSLGNISLRSKFNKKQEKPRVEASKLETVKSNHSESDHTDQTLAMLELPSFETDAHMFDDMFVSINNVSEQAEHCVTSSIPVGPRLTTKDPFLKDDELTSAQIHDQQIKDEQEDEKQEDEKQEDEKQEDEKQDDEKQEDKQDADLQTSRHSSDNTYIDDNIRFLQGELQWTKLDDHKFDDEVDVQSTKKVDYDNDDNEIAPESKERGNVDTIVMTHDQLNLIFNNLSELQRRHLPGHLKYIKQFKDFKYIEVSVTKFEDLSGINLSNHLLQSSPSILKKSEGEYVFRNNSSMLSSNESKKRVMFSNKIYVNETYAAEMYKRYNKSVTQYTLTESYEINRIKSELNSYKCNEMLVHESSQNNTHFFY